MTRARGLPYALAACLVPGAANAQSPLPPPPAPPPGWVAPPAQSAPPATTAPPAAALPPVWVPPPAYAPSAYLTVPIQLDVTEPGVDVLVFPPGANVEHDAPIARCAGACVVNLTPGKYKVYVTETDATVSGSRTLELRGPTRLVLDPDMQEHRSAGLVLGITGPIMVVAGMVAILSQISIDSEQTRGSDAAVQVGVLGIIGGLVATPVGWVMYGTSFKPEYDLQPLASSGYGRVPSSLARSRVRGPGLTWGMTF